MRISIVTTLFYSAPYLREYYERMSKAVAKITDDYEIIFVNDGSPDESLDIAVDIHRSDAHVKVVDLSRNFGHHRAMMTGLEHAQGELLFVLDCDLEELPESIVDFYETLQANPNADVVYGSSPDRKGGWFERVSGALFYTVLNWLSYYPIPPNHTTARLMTRRYTNAVLQHREHEVFLGGIWAITGFEQIPMVVERSSKGTTTYTLRLKIAVAVRAITSFSNKPLVYVFYLGCIIVAVSSAAAFYLIVRWSFFGPMAVGWPSLMVSIWFLGGLTIFSLGIIGIYLSYVFSETKNRPYTVVRKFYESEEHQATQR